MSHPEDIFKNSSMYPKKFFNHFHHRIFRKLDLDVDETQYGFSKLRRDQGAFISFQHASTPSPRALETCLVYPVLYTFTQR